MKRRVREGIAELSSVLVDTNVILDVAEVREPWLVDSLTLLDLIRNGRLRGFVAGHSLTTIGYVVRRARGAPAALEAVSRTLNILDVVPLGTTDFREAVDMGLSDFEDAVQAVACLRAGASVLATRNERDYRGAPVATRTPAAIVSWFRRFG